jgi:hypothetical protein
MAASARDTVGWLKPISLAICVPDLGPVASLKRRSSSGVVIDENYKMNDKCMNKKLISG